MSSIEDDVLSRLDESAKVIFEALLTNAEELARRCTRNGTPLVDAYKLVRDHFSLNGVERSVLAERLRKPDPVQQNNIPDTAKVSEDVDRNNVIYFEGATDLDEATRILMDKSIDWSEKNSDNDRPYVQFNDDHKLAEAHSALRRKWDFVESRKRLVADVQFDNLNDYSKVLEFMRRQGMLLEFSNGVELDEDYDQIQNKAVEDQKIAEKENRPYSQAKQANSFLAKSRAPAQKDRVDPFNESRFRSVHTRRKFQVK